MKIQLHKPEGVEIIETDDYSDVQLKKMGLLDAVIRHRAEKYRRIATLKLAKIEAQDNNDPAVVDAIQTEIGAL